MKKVLFLDTVEIYYYNKDTPIHKPIQKHKVKTTKLYNSSYNYTINIIILVILSVIYIIIIF